VLTAFRKGAIPPKRPQTFTDLHNITSQKTFIFLVGLRGEERRGVYRVLVGNPEERDHLGDPGVDGRIILR
jgi:hypothetical protein